MIKKYRKKQIVVEAVQYLGELTHEIYCFLTGADPESEEKIYMTPEGEHFYMLSHNGDLFIKTLEGDMLVSNGDYIIKGIKGEFYPCKPDIFEASYDSEEILACCDNSDESELHEHYPGEAKVLAELVKEIFDKEDYAVISLTVNSAIAKVLTHVHISVWVEMVKLLKANDIYLRRSGSDFIDIGLIVPVDNHPA